MSKKILVVDDSATIRRKVTALLESSGFTVVQARDGQDGLEKVTREQMDMLIVDVNMPVMNGFQLIDAVRSLRDYGDTPIFMLTNESTRAVMVRGREAGATAWIIKPFDGAKLLAGISRVLGA